MQERRKISTADGTSRQKRIKVGGGNILSAALYG